MISDPVMKCNFWPSANMVIRGQCRLIQSVKNLGYYYSFKLSWFVLQQVLDLYNNYSCYLLMFAMPSLLLGISPSTWGLGLRTNFMLCCANFQLGHKKQFPNRRKLHCQTSGKARGHFNFPPTTSCSFRSIPLSVTRVALGSVPFHSYEKQRAAVNVLNFSCFIHVHSVDREPVELEVPGA
jgi:hypothetical protein